MTSIALRPVTPADSEFCYRLHRAAMGEYITAVFVAKLAATRLADDRAQPLTVRLTVPAAVPWGLAAARGGCCTSP